MNPTRLVLLRTFAGFALAASASCLFLSFASAQSGGNPPMAGHWHGRSGPGAWGHHGFAKVVTGEPYTAQAVTSTVETLSNGTSITRQITAQIARDNSGRTMRSETFSGFGAAGSQNGAIVVSIFDPVANQRIEYNTATKTARIFVLPQRSSGESASNNEQPAKHGNGFRGSQGTVQTESLGTQTIGGIAAQGTKTVRTIAAGTIGNSQALQTTEERWYSSDLQIVVQSTRNDPRFGQTTYTVSNIQRTEPSESLFQVPSGYQSKTIDVPAHNTAQ